MEYGFKIHYKAQNPNKLAHEHDIKEQIIKDILPTLHSKFTLGDKSQVEYYAGKNEIKGLYLKILDEVEFRQKYYVIGDQELFLRVDEVFFNGFIRKRNKLNPEIKMFFTQTDAALESMKIQANHFNNVQIKLLPDQTTFTANIIITEKRVVVNRLSDPISATSLTNPDIIDTFIQMFELFWESVG